jgi:hypothetical protein
MLEGTPCETKPPLSRVFPPPLGCLLRRVLTNGSFTRPSPTTDYEAMLSECESSLSTGAACILHDFHHVKVHTLRQLVYASIGRSCLECMFVIHPVDINRNCCDDRVGGNGF